MQHALIVGGSVAEFLHVPEGYTLDECYHEDVVARCVDAPDNVRQGWLYDGKSFVAPPPPPPVDLRAYAAAARYAKEIGGVMVGNASIATDRDSQAMITGAYSWSLANLSTPIPYKTASGFVIVSAAQMAAIAMAVGAHVQACFAAEATVDAAIAAGTITTMAQVDAAFAAPLSAG